MADKLAGEQVRVASALALFDLNSELGFRRSKHELFMNAQFRVGTSAIWHLGIRINQFRQVIEAIIARK